MEVKIKRYPSIRAFQKNESRLFIGRDQETRLLFNKVVAEKIVLLFARSGIGKSSLINAGLVPMLEERGFLPLDIRLSTSDDPSDTPIRIFRKLLDHYLDKELYDQLLKDLKQTEPDYQPGLWEFFQCCSFPLASTPVLVLDQFEQFFSFSVPVQNEFLLQLKSLLSDAVPVELWDWYNELTDPAMKAKYYFLLTEPDFRVLFAIRSDKIFEMNRLSQIIPNILRSRFELYPLKEEEAIRAISVPASINSPDTYLSARFSYHEILLHNIITRLKGGNDIIETTQLQIICSEIESRIILSHPPKPDNYEVTETDLKSIGGIENIVSHFYQNQVKKMGTEKEEELVKILIEDNLYDKAAKSRKIAFKEAVMNILKAGKEKLGITTVNEDQFINKLLGLRLIREDYRENKKFYEISHDYLLNAINESFDLRESKRLALANEELERNNANLSRLREQAVDAQRQAEEALTESKKQEELARKASEEAFRQRTVAFESKRKVEKLKKRNDVLALVLVLLAAIGIVYLLRVNASVRSKKAEIELLSKRATKGLISIFNTEAEKRYAMGDRLVAYTLWDSARYYNPDDTTISKKLAREYPLLAGYKIEVTKDGRYACVQYMNAQFKIWEFAEGENQVNDILSIDEISGFGLLPGNRLIVIDLEGVPYQFHIGKDTACRRITSDTLYVSETFETYQSANLIKFDGREGNELYFYSLDELRPMEELNYWLKKRLGGTQQSYYYDFYPLDKNNLFIRFNSFTTQTKEYYLYKYPGKSAPVRIYPPELGRFAVSDQSKKLAYSDGGQLKLYDPLTGLSTPTGLAMEANDFPVEFLDNDSIVFVTEAGNVELAFVLYDLRNKKIVFSRSDKSYTSLQKNKAMNLLGFVDKEKKLILYNTQTRVPVYPVGALISEKGVLDYQMYESANKVFIRLAEGKLKVLHFNANGSISVSYSDYVPPASLYSENYYDLPSALYGNQLYVYRENVIFNGGVACLKFQDSARTSIGYIRPLFQRYIDREMRKVLGE